MRETGDSERAKTRVVKDVEEFERVFYPVTAARQEREKEWRWSIIGDLGAVYDSTVGPAPARRPERERNSGR